MGDAHAAAATTLSGFSSSVVAGISTDMGFKDVTTAMAFVRSHALRQNKQLCDDGKTRCGTSRKLVCTCKDCPFYVRFKKRSMCELPWVIVEVHLFHAPSCTSIAKPKPRELVQLDVFKNAMAANPSISASKLAAVIQDESGMVVEPHTADRARRLLTQGADASDAIGDSARTRARDGDVVDAVTECGSATTVEEYAQLMGIWLERTVPPLRDFPLEFHSSRGSGPTTVQAPERTLEQRNSNFNHAQQTVDVTHSLQTLLEDFQHLNDGSLVRCEYDTSGRFVRAFASCGVFAQASSKNQQVFGFECITASSTDGGFHKYLLGKDANMETVVLAVAVVEGSEAALLDHHEWFFRCVAHAAVDIKTGAVIATLTDELLAVSSKLGFRLVACARSLQKSNDPDVSKLARALAVEVARDRIPLYGWSTRDFLPVDNDQMIDTTRAFTARQQPMCPLDFMESVMEKWRRDSVLRDRFLDSWELITELITPAAKKMWEREWYQLDDVMTVRFGGRFFFGGIEVDTDRNTCSCGFMGQHGIPCRHMTIVVFRPFDLDIPFWNRFATIYRIESYRSAYKAKTVKVPIRKSSQVEERLGAISDSLVRSPRNNQPEACGFKHIDRARETEMPPPQKKRSDARNITLLAAHPRPRRRWSDESPNGASFVSPDAVEADATLPYGTQAGEHDESLCKYNGGLCPNKRAIRSMKHGLSPFCEYHRDRARIHQRAYLSRCRRAFAP